MIVKCPIHEAFVAFMETDREYTIFEIGRWYSTCEMVHNEYLETIYDGNLDERDNAESYLETYLDGFISYIEYLRTETNSQEIDELINVVNKHFR